jgi:hypothetical protein
MMPNMHSSLLPRVLRALAAMLIVKVTVSVLAEYRFYWPPDFESDFLRGRRGRAADLEIVGRLYSGRL